MDLDERFVRSLRAIVGPQHVIDDPDLTARYRVDWTGRFEAATAVVVRPRGAPEVASIVQSCIDHEVAIVAQGGNTGLVGGSVPLSGELVLSTERMTEIEPIAPHAGVFTAGAGTTLAALRDAARAHGWEYGVDLASRDSATLGGTIATNAGGTRVVRYGDTRRQVVGIEIVTGSAAVISDIHGSLRDNTGYHLPSIVTGSEGTLGIVTRACVRFVPRLDHRTTALLRFDHEGAAVVAAEAMRATLESIESIELFFADGLELVCTTFGLAPPFTDTGGGYVLVEAAATEDPTESLAAAVGDLSSVSDVAVVDDDIGRRRLWQYRERHTDAIATVGVPHKLDVALPPGRLAEFIERVPVVVTGIVPGARTWMFGHGGESAVHVNVTGLRTDDDHVDDAVLRLVAELGGSISAEHGIGRAKRDLIGLAHPPEHLRLLAGVKAAFDPSGIMNPAVLLPPGR